MPEVVADSPSPGAGRRAGDVQRRPGVPGVNDRRDEFKWALWRQTHEGLTPRTTDSRALGTRFPGREQAGQDASSPAATIQSAGRHRSAGVQKDEACHGALGPIPLSVRLTLLRLGLPCKVGRQLEAEALRRAMLGNATPNKCAVLREQVGICPVVIRLPPGLTDLHRREL